MQLTFTLLALATATIVAAQGTSKSAGPPPPGCSTDFNGHFEVTVILPSKKRSIEERDACSGEGTLVVTLAGSILTDAKGRTGSIVANHQFQFDGPPQPDALFTSGFSVCSNGTIALGPSATVFYQCRSGSFYNIYHGPAGADCQAVDLQVIACGGSSGSGQGGDGQPTGPSATKVATQISDGQVQASSAVPKVSQIGDGQVQASSAPPQPVAQFTDGQIQVTGPVVTATPQAPASSTNNPVAQISDGQVQASVTTTPAAVSQASDGQPQAGAATSAATLASTPAAPLATTGGAALVKVGTQFSLAIVGLVAALML